MILDIVCQGKDELVVSHTIIGSWFGQNIFAISCHNIGVKFFITKAVSV